MKKIIIALAATLISTSALANTVSLQNASFEINTVGNWYGYGNVAAGWSFTGGGAVSHNGTPWYGNTLSGDYFAVLQNTASISQTFSNSSAASYTIGFDMALRPYYSTGQVVSVSLDGHTLGTYDAASTGWNAFTTGAISLAAGSHTLTFAGLNPHNASDTSAFIDNISMNVAAVPEPETYAMLLAGLGLVAGVARRRKA
ncbi:FxDxF family PEP-CTERM protein [Pseudoduganella danionis]|nr:FxDxF family PEP-CTERM protein [Pseudoduganella danionis]